MTIEKFRCIEDAAAVPFFVTAAASLALFGFWLRRHYKLSNWQLLLMIFGFVRVRREWKVNVLNILAVLAPMIVLIVLAHHNCGPP